MKKALTILSFALFISIVFYGCKNEPDPCENLLCLNGGNCVDGLCDCPTGYGGLQCETELTPTKVLITKIVLTKFPSFDPSGGEWDPDDHTGPDLYIRIVKGKTEIYKSTKKIWDVKLNQEYTFDLSSSPVELTSITSKHKIQLWDFEDYNNDDFMGEYEFIPFHSGENFPDKYDLGDHWSEVGYTVHVEYEFN